MGWAHVACAVKVFEGGGDVLPTELPHLTRKERDECVRLRLSNESENDMKIQIDEVFSVKKI